jgi:adenylate cyclase
MAQAVDAEKIGQLVEWLVDGARPSANGRTIVRQFCERLNGAGVPVDLYRLFIFTIHPSILGRRLQWTAATGTTITEADFAFFSTAEFKDNPIPMVMRTGKGMRRRLTPEAGKEFPVLADLIRDGFTDYLIQPVIYVDGDVHTMSWATKHPEGFSDAAIAALERVRAPITRLAESYILRLNAENIISTYVGREAGAKVLSGQIKRGDAEDIRAVILFADVKGFTDFAAGNPVVDVLARLNRFFDAFEEPIARHGGEILKFIGDGLLAIFPLGAAVGSEKTTAQAALAAVAEARAALDREAIGFRSALHVGSLSYGNMGAKRRLDFTAIGAPVNLAARLLGAAGDLGVDDVISADLAEALGRPCALAGLVNLKGVPGETAVHLPPHPAAS